MVTQNKPKEEPETKPLQQEQPKEILSPGGRGLVLENIYFDFDSYQLRRDAMEILDQHSRTLIANPEQLILVEGHCDERGSVHYNRILGERRAKAVKEYLVASGIAAKRIYTRSYGEERPLDTGHNEEAWAMNRRASFTVSSNTMASPQSRNGFIRFGQKICSKLACIGLGLQLL